MRHSHKFLPDRTEAISAAATESVAPPQRIGFWCDVLTGILNSTVQVEAPPAESLDAKIIRFVWSTAQLIEMTVTPHAIRVTPHSENDSMFVLVSPDGRERVAQNGREACLSVGSFCICDGALPWTLDFTGPARHVILIMPGKRLREIFPDWPQMAAMEISGEGGASAIFFELIASLCRHRGTVNEEAATELASTIAAALTAALRSLPQFHQTAPSQLETYHKERIRNHVKAHLRDPGLSVESVALEAGLSTRYVHRLFATEAIPLMKWVWMERLDHCCRDLGLNSLRNRSVSEIAFYWGFNNPAHFSRAFRNRFGLSPTDYRQQTLRSTSASAADGATVVALNPRSRQQKKQPR